MSQTSSTALNKIKVNPVLILLVAIGVITVGAGDVLKAVAGYDDMGRIIAQWLVVVGSVFIAIGPIAYLGTLKKRIGILAVTLSSLAFLARAAAELPTLIDTINDYHPFWAPFFYRAVGASYLMIAISIFSIFWLKEERQSRHESSPELSIAPDFRTLAAIGVTTLIISISYFLMATPRTGGRMPLILATAGPLIIVVVLIATFARSSKLLGRTGVTLGILGFAISGLSSFPWAISDTALTSDAWRRFLGNGCEGIFHLMLGLALLSAMNFFKDSRATDKN
jgi:hypothetical protein